MPKIRFLQSRQVVDHDGEVVASFKAGEVYDLSAHSADRWLRRLVAKVADTQGEGAGEKPKASRARKSTADTQG